MKTKILCFNGPNLNLLGLREPLKYGYKTLADLEQNLRSLVSKSSHLLKCFQSNHEGKLIDDLHAELLEHHCGNQKILGLILNAGGLSHTSISLADAVEIFRQFDIPVYEVHVSQVFEREEFRRHSFISAHANAVIVGMGTRGYEIALQSIMDTNS